MFKILVIIYVGNIDTKSIHSQELSFDSGDRADIAYSLLKDKIKPNTNINVINSGSFVKEVIKLY